MAAVVEATPTMEATPTIEATQQDGSALEMIAKYREKMMTLKLSQLKKRAKKNGIPDEAIETAAAGADDEEDAKCVIISLILKANIVKATPSPTRARAASKLMFYSQECKICPGCIRPPGHDGECMDGQCEELFPEPEKPKEEFGLDAGAEVARHKVVKAEITRQVEEAARQKAAAEEEAQRTVAEEKEKARRKAAEAKKNAELEETRRKAAEEKMEKEAKAKAAEEKASQQAERLRRCEAAEAAAAQQKAAEKEAARQKAVEEEAARQFALEAEAARQRAVELEAAQQRAAAEDLLATQWRAAEEEEQAQQKAIEDAARENEMEERRARQRAQEEEMDALLFKTFLDCATCSWQERVRTPLKGTILYTKHMRPCRPAGTSVKVQDSTFRSLLNFLQFCEGEGLLSLKPGLTDPVVTNIHLDAVRNYKYTPQSQAPKESTARIPTLSASFSPQSLLCPTSGNDVSGPVTVNSASWLGCSKRFQ